MIEVLTMILAGGRGERLMPLTLDRAKPSVPFAGAYRIIDFCLSNFINSKFYHIKVLTQFMSDSLNKHLSRGWNIHGPVGHFVDPVPAQMRTGERWYTGTADAVFQNQNLIWDLNPEHVAVFGGDHIYKMNVAEMFRFHLRRGAKLTVACIPYPVEEAANRFGILVVDDKSRIIAFEEKPANPTPMPGNPEMALVSMGNYFWETQGLRTALFRDREKGDNSNHDFGKDIIPDLVERGEEIYAYDYSLNWIPGEGEREKTYWRDVGTLDSYWEANMEVRSVHPPINMYNYSWPIRTLMRPFPPAKFVFAEKGGRYGQAIDSMIASGSIISGSTVRDSLISHNVFVHSYSKVEHSILFADTDIGRHCRIRKAIIDKNCIIEEGVKIGYDKRFDRANFTVTENGIVVVPKWTHVKSNGEVTRLQGPYVSDEEEAPHASSI
ncbi:MAG TPA: glucose-1-phosphate adenylyltransferase [bacterium]|jgi:glucose-1-phosphate adenylyltransferase